MSFLLEKDYLPSCDINERIDSLPLSFISLAEEQILHIFTYTDMCVWYIFG